MIDVTHQINSVSRQVGTRTLEAGEGRTVTVSQTYDSPIDDVWDAVTSIERIPRWFAPITGDLRLGGRYQLEGNAGGTIERCDPPNGFFATWEYAGATSWIEVSLTGTPGGGTRFELVHIAQVDDKIWDEFGPGAVGTGWDLGFLGLALYLTSGVGNPEQDPSWPLSEEGRLFASLSSEGWRAADVAAGADPDQAAAAAERVAAFYTAAPPES
ncbi:activator of HSP90 ATPase [Microtetraspora sp. NBRC 13810]|uniref:SRPBCC family protein n=1 Tax=Microtetraspora sp. NBRC 13810 TaxID=3030990 RepID=UPI0024A46743|nr:SRPBCC family protein [Microtetraspora sp. NBRC 13810]GLW09988.1 activator of HSP90 ATPase [Microtetraspora sp. NBRC 13810]